MDPEHKPISLIDELINVLDNVHNLLPVETKSDSPPFNENKDFLNSIATVNWVTICAFAHTETLVCLSMICKELYQIINQNEYLANQTLLSPVKNNINSINLMYKNCRFNDVDDIDLLNTQAVPVTLPLFTPNIFKRMSLFPNTKLFQCYSRLISYNWRLHYTIEQNSFLQLAKVHNKLTKSQFKYRNLNNFETKLFAIANKPFYKGLKCEKITFEVKLNDTIANIKVKISPKQHKKLKNDDISGIEKECVHFNYKNLFEAAPTKNKFTINSFDNFITNLNKFGYYHKWKGIIFELGFFLAGGMVLKCLLKNYFDQNELNESTKKDLDFFACNMNFDVFQMRIAEIKSKFIDNGLTVVESFNAEEDYGGTHIRNLYVNFSGLKTNAYNVSSRSNSYLREGQWEYNKKCIEKEGFWTHLQFIHISKGFKSWSILHIFDLDCCQVGFNGKEVLSTYAFIQSINTQTMINYKTIAEPRLYDIWMKRTIKYARRGFQFIVNHKFNMKEERDPNCKFVITWDDCRQKALEQCFTEENTDMHTAFEIHSNGGFGLNNDCFGVRRQFIQFFE